MHERHACLFEPIKIGPKTLKNRFYQVPQCAGFGVVSPFGQAAHRAMKAAGGWGAVCTEACSVCPDSDDTPQNSERLWDAHDVKRMALITESVHAHDALAGVELWHGGLIASNLDTRAVIRGASQMAGKAGHFVTTCQQLDRDEIRKAQQHYVDAAGRALDAGFDIVYIYGGHDGQLPGQFLSPFYNQRGDEYGGSLVNRARMFREVIEQVRSSIGDRCAIAVRISADNLMGDAGILLERDVLPFVELVDELVDLWDIVLGRDLAEDATPSRFHPAGRQLPWQAAVKAVTRKPVVGVGRFTDPDQMADAVSSGKLDIIGAARPSIADPFLPNKIRDGRLDEIRECIGCNMCLARYTIGEQLVCTQNPTAGEEYRRGWHPERFGSAHRPDSTVLVVGAGPAGLECARVLGERGMSSIRLVEAGDDIGGNLRWVAKLPGLGEWSRVIEYRRTQLTKLPAVEVALEVPFDLGDVAASDADIVIVATGAHWATDGMNPATRRPIPGAAADLPHVLTPEQIMVHGKPVPGNRVVVIDNDGYHVGPSLAQKLAEEGKHVTIVTHLGEVAPFMRHTLEFPNTHRMFHRLGITTVASHRVLGIEPGAVSIASAYASDDDVSQSLEADAVVLVTQRVSDDGLYRALKDHPEASRAALYRIGDCAAPRDIADCIFDGHRLARELESSDPAVPLPFLRERVAADAPATPDQLAVMRDLARL